MPMIQSPSCNYASFSLESRRGLARIGESRIETLQCPALLIPSKSVGKPVNDMGSTYGSRGLKDSSFRLPGEADPSLHSRPKISQFQKQWI